MASKRHQRRKACENKDKLTQGDAHARAMAASRRQGESIHAYRCPHCKRYHTGHVTAQQKAARRAKGW